MSAATAGCHSKSCPSSSSLASGETPLPSPRAKNNPCLLLEIRILLTHGDTEAGGGMGLAQELSVPLVFQISNVSFFVLSPALLYLNRQYCQKKAVPLYFVSGLLLLIGGYQHCGKTRQVARLPSMRLWRVSVAKAQGKLGWATKQPGLFEACSPWLLPAVDMQFQPCNPHGVTGATQSRTLEHQNTHPTLQELWILRNGGS